jgi:hypothetical protein
MTLALLTPSQRASSARERTSPELSRRCHSRARSVGSERRATDETTAGGYRQVENPVIQFLFEAWLGSRNITVVRKNRGAAKSPQRAVDLLAELDRHAQRSFCTSQPMAASSSTRVGSSTRTSFSPAKKVVMRMLERGVRNTTRLGPNLFSLTQRLSAKL